MAQNIAFSASLYSGQMCTAPQNVYVPAEGVNTAEGNVSFDDGAPCGILGRDSELVIAPRERKKRKGKL